MERKDIRKVVTRLALTGAVVTAGVLGARKVASSCEFESNLDYSRDRWSGHRIDLNAKVSCGKRGVFGNAVLATGGLLHGHAGISDERGEKLVLGGINIDPDSEIGVQLAYGERVSEDENLHILKGGDLSLQRSPLIGDSIELKRWDKTPAKDKTTITSYNLLDKRLDIYNR